MYHKVVVQLAIPACFNLDIKHIEQLKYNNQISDFEFDQDYINLYVDKLEPGKVLKL